MSPRCVCGYGPEWHPAPGHCPLCGCGRSHSEHLPVAVTPSPLQTYSPLGDPMTWDGKQLAVCPGKPLTAAGKLPTLRRGSYRAPGQALFELHGDGWDGVLFPAAGSAPESDDEPAVAPPQVPARYTTSLDEIPRQAMAAGKQVAALGWAVDPWYYRAADGTGVSVLLMRRGGLRAWAAWERAPGGTWKTQGGHAWAPGSFPVKVGIKRLLEIITELG